MLSSGDLRTGVRCSLNCFDQQLTAESLTLVAIRDRESGQWRHPDLMMGSPLP